MADKQVLARFVTKLPPELRVPASEVAVPATLKRYGLSQIINHLLALDPPRPFDFLIDGELIRRSLEQHLLSRGASLEQAVEIEYVPAVPPPAERGAPPSPQDDWVSCVCALAAGARLATGCYDGVVRLWEAGAGLAEEEGEEGEGAEAAPAVEAACAFLAHRGGVTCAAAAGAAAGSGGGVRLLVTAGKDHKARLWRLEADDGAAAAAAGSGRGKGGSSSSRGKQQQQQQKQHQQLAELAGHTDTVEALALLSRGGGDRCATGGWDGALLVWRGGRELERAAADAPSGAATPDRNKGAAAAAKRRRVAADVEGGDAAQALAPPLTERPLARLELASASASAAASGRPGAAGGHCVSALAWPSRSCLYSGGYDHSVRLWDAEHGGAAVAACPTSRPVLALAVPAPLLSLAEGGGAEGEEEEEAGGGGHLVAFGSADGILRLWDARAGPQVALAAGGGGDPASSAGAAAAGGPESGGASATARAVGSGGRAGAWVASVAWRPGSLHHVATASHDGCLRLFDLRTPVPLGTLAGLHHAPSGGKGEQGGGKALCVAWWSGGGNGSGGGGGGVPRFLASGGTDCRLRVSALPAGCGDGIL